MSSQWEVVGKKRDKGASKVVPQKNGKESVKKKPVNLNVKVEEVLAKSQVKSLYNEKNKENKPVEKKSQESGAKKTQKKQQEKPQEVVKAKPKSIESALNQLDVEDFKSVYEKSKSQFPNVPIVWLKELAQYLNQRLSYEVHDPTFAAKPENYPLSAVPSALKSVMEKAVKETDKGNIHLFFDITLTSMATDMSKNLPALGHKLFLQIIALSEPDLVVASLPKHCVLRNSYLNRPNIGLSILWAVGQAGVDFQAGFTIFEELMLPLIELKNYSRFIYKYLLKLMTNTKEVPLSIEQHICIGDNIFFVKKNFPNDLKPDLEKAMANLNHRLFINVDNDALEGYFDVYFQQLAMCSNKSYQECICDIIVECFSRNLNSVNNWFKIFDIHFDTTVVILNYIENNWDAIGGKSNIKTIIDFLETMDMQNNERIAMKLTNDRLLEMDILIKKVLKKIMATKKKSGFSFKFFIFWSTIILAGLVYLDVRQQGSWQHSKTQKMLKDSGACEYAHLAFGKVKGGLSLADGHIEQIFPGYRKTVGDFVEPYIELTKNLGIILYNLGVNLKEVAQEKYPVVIDSIEAYAPGLVEHSQNAVNNVWSSSVFYYNRSVDYLRKEVFVGQLSPENMQRVVFEALNTTQIKATEYYHWLYEKVQTTIK